MRRNSGLHTGVGNRTTQREDPEVSSQLPNKTKGKGKEKKKKKKEKIRETMKRREIMLKYVPNINPGQ